MLRTKVSALFLRAGPVDPLQFEHFEQYAWQVTGRGGLLASLSGPALLLAWWFTDGLTHSDPVALHALARWRGAMIALGLVGSPLLLVRLRRGLDPTFQLSAQYLFMCAFSYYSFSLVGGPGTPWIHTSCLLPLPSLVMLLPLGRRAALVLAVSLTTLLAYYLPNPAFLDDPYTWNALAMMATSALFSCVFGHALFEMSRRNFEQRWDLERLATLDALTGLNNRRRLLERAGEELRRARRYQHPLCLLMLDMDHFKRINDERGHDAGDAVLRAFGQLLRTVLRESDVAGRLGGEEFAAILPEAGLSDAVAAAERIRGALHAAAPGSALRGVTVSVGVAALRGSDPGIDALLKRADEALYMAKRGGRDQVAIAADPEAPRAG